MKEWEITIDVPWRSQTIARIIERVSLLHELRVALKAELRSFPGSVHWHLKRPRESGTLEVTMWPERRRVWLSVQSGRTADWIDASLPKVVSDIERELNAKRKEG